MKKLTNILLIPILLLVFGSNVQAQFVSSRDHGTNFEIDLDLWVTVVHMEHNPFVDCDVTVTGFTDDDQPFQQIYTTEPGHGIWTMEKLKSATVHVYVNAGYERYRNHTFVFSNPSSLELLEIDIPAVIPEEGD